MQHLIHRLVRWRILPVLVIVGAIFACAFSLMGTSVHAAPTQTPTVSLPPTLHPFRLVPVTAQGFEPGESVDAYVPSVNNNGPSTTLSCDTTGTCTGQLSLLGTFLPYGPHTLIAVGITSGLQAQTTFSLVAGISVLPNKGGVGTALKVNGAAFVPNEIVNIYWGTPSEATFVGSATCDTDGAFTFTNKDNGDPFVATGMPGPSHITVVRQNTKPTTFTTVFHILTPKIQAPASIKFGKPANTTVSGFGAHETVTFRWNANGGQVLGTTRTDFIGRAVGNFAYPSTPPGSYTLTVTGATSGLTATKMVTTGAGIEVGITSFTFPGETLTIYGGGFTPDQSVQVYFQAKANGIVTTTADATGAFTVPLTLPNTYNPTTAYNVHAVSADGTQKAKAPVSFSPPDFVQDISEGGFGLSTPLQGDNFAVGETVEIDWNYGQSNQLVLGTTLVDTNGQFSTLVTVPSSSYGSSVVVAAVGRTSHLVVTETATPAPGLLFPTSIPGGIPVQLQGGNFGQNETVTLQLFWSNGTTTTAGTAQTDDNGAFSTDFVAPLSSLTINRQFSIIATGTSSGASATAPFIERPELHITPTTGPSGTVITLTAQGYLPFSTAPVIWFDPRTFATIALGTADVDGNGQFTFTLTTPDGLVSGATYYVEALASNGQFIRVNFTAQG